MRKLAWTAVMLAVLGYCWGVYHLVAELAETSSYNPSVLWCDDILYAVDGHHGLKVYNMVNPAEPSLIGSYSGHFSTARLALLDTLLYICANDSYLKVLDVSNPQSISLEHNCDFGNDFGDIDIDNDILYAVEEDSIHFINLSNPLNPILYCSCPANGVLRQIEANGSYLSVLNEDFGFQVYYKSALNINLLQTISLPDPVHMQIVDNTAYVADRTLGLVIIDIQEPYAPELISSHPTPATLRSISVEDSIAYLCGEHGVIEAYNVSDPLNVSYIGRRSGRFDLTYIVVEDQMALVIGEHSQASLFDVSDPTMEGFAWESPFGEKKHSLQMVDDRCYMISDDDSHNSRVLVYSLDDSVLPVLLGSYENEYLQSIYDPRNMHVVDHIAYIHYEALGLEEDLVAVIDLTDPTSPVELSLMPLPAYIDCFKGTDDKLFFSVVREGVSIRDLVVSFPELSFIPHEMNCSNLACTTNNALCLNLSDINGNSPLYFYDISDPLNPVETACFDDVPWHGYLTAYDNYIYCRTPENELRVFDLTTPSSPTLALSLPLSDVTPWKCNVKCAMDDRLFMSDDQNVLHIFSLQDPLNPVYQQSIPMDRSIGSIHANNNLLYMTNGIAGFNIFNLDLLAVSPDAPSPPPIAALTAYPNPFNPETTVAYNIPQRGEVELAVYNIRGQRVATLVSDRRESGKHIAVWRGEDDNGHPVSSGVYFARLRASGVEQTTKLLLLK